MTEEEEEFLTSWEDVTWIILGDKDGNAHKVDKQRLKGMLREIVADTLQEAWDYITKE